MLCRVKVDSCVEHVPDIALPNIARYAPSCNTFGGVRTHRASMREHLNTSFARSPLALWGACSGAIPMCKDMNTEKY